MGGGGPNQKCGYNSFVVLGDRSKFIDQQTLKLQVGMRRTGARRALDTFVYHLRHMCIQKRHTPNFFSPLVNFTPQTSQTQERPEDVPTGELPRTLLMVADRHLVGRVTPGTRVRVTGIYCTHRSKVGATGMGRGGWVVECASFGVGSWGGGWFPAATDTFTNRPLIDPDTINITPSIPPPPNPPRPWTRPAPPRPSACSSPT
jgi:hypothetical protein